MQSQAENTSTPFPELFVRVVFQQEGDTEHTRRKVSWVQECARDLGFQGGVSARGADAHKAPGAFASHSGSKLMNGELVVQEAFSTRNVTPFAALCCHFQLVSSSPACVSPCAHPMKAEHLSESFHPRLGGLAPTSAISACFPLGDDVSWFFWDLLHSSWLDSDGYRRRQTAATAPRALRLGAVSSFGWKSQRPFPGAASSPPTP